MSNHAGFAVAVVIDGSTIQRTLKKYQRAGGYLRKQIRPPFFKLDVPIGTTVIHIGGDLVFDFPKVILEKRSDDQIGIDLRFTATIGISSSIAPSVGCIFVFRTRVFASLVGFPVKIKDPASATGKEKTALQVGISFTDAVVESLDTEKFVGPDLISQYNGALHDPRTLAALTTALRTAFFYKLFLTPPILDQLSAYGLSVGRIVIKPLDNALAVAVDVPGLTNGDPSSLFDFNRKPSFGGYYREWQPDRVMVGDEETYEVPKSELSPFELNPPARQPFGSHNADMASCVNPLVTTRVFESVAKPEILKTIPPDIWLLEINLNLLSDKVNVSGSVKKILDYGFTADADFSFTFRVVISNCTYTYLAKPNGLTIELTSSDVELPVWFHVLEVAGIILGGATLAFIDEMILEIIAGAEAMVVAKIVAKMPVTPRSYTTVLPGVGSLSVVLSDIIVRSDGITSWFNIPDHDPPEEEWYPMILLHPTSISPWYFVPITAELFIEPGYLPIGYFSPLDSAVRIHWEVRRGDTLEAILVKDQSTLDPGALKISFTRTDPVLATLPFFYIYCRLYRPIGSIMYDIFDQVGFVEIKDRLDRTIPYVYWEYYGGYTKYKKGSNVVMPVHWVGPPGHRHKLRLDIERVVSFHRVSNIHRTAVPGRCRFADQYSLTHAGAVLKYIYELPFPTSDIVKHRERLCDYCFFGGPDKTTLLI